ncbi:C3HC-type domain-containing protein [Heracleum sosnowskyi]|uniref:C3HC-type domain-containing protein n=1 Tax=Heracleum sosnowskyi TaxID=360622 RepID=A0AAD8GSR6_9APIA|nr:C3HC-type domain-containing protein [Heracleum sosnowskyi]
MKASRSLELERFLDQLQDFTVGDSGLKADVTRQPETNRNEVSCVYTRAQKLISLCGWERRWLPNIQDCEEHSAQSARNGYSMDHKDSGNLNDPWLGKKEPSSSVKKDSKKKEVLGSKSNGDSRCPLLDCSLCGATVRILDFLSVSRPARFAPSIVDIPQTSKKLALRSKHESLSPHYKEQPPIVSFRKFHQEHIYNMPQTFHFLTEAAMVDEGKSMSNIGVDLNLTMGGGLSSAQVNMNMTSDQPQDVTIGRDLMIGQPSSSEVGDRAASYESRGPSTRKRNLEEGGSTVDRPHLLIRQADSVEGTVIDSDGDEVNDGEQYSAGPSKRSREAYAFETNQSSYRRDSSGAGPSRSLVFEINRDANRDDQFFGIPSTRDSARASSVIAMDTIGHSADDDSMESVENRPGEMDDVQFPMAFRNPDLNETSELNYSNQAQQSVWLPAIRVAGDVGVSSTNEEEVLNTDTTNARGRDGPSFGMSGGSVGMGASHEAEIHSADLSVHRADSVVGDMEPVAEVTENQGQTGEFAPDPGLMGDYVPQEMEREYPHGDSQDMMSGSVARADSGSKIVGSGKVDSVESGEKTSDMHLLPNENSNHPSHSCNAILYSGYEASKDEVTQAGKASPTDDS